MQNFLIGVAVGICIVLAIIFMKEPFLNWSSNQRRAYCERDFLEDTKCFQTAPAETCARLMHEKCGP